MTGAGVEAMQSRLDGALSEAIQELYECLWEYECEETGRIDQEITNRLARIEKARDDLKTLLEKTDLPQAFYLETK